MGLYYLETFNINSSTIQVTDPVYTSLENKGYSCTIDNVKNGRWQIFAYVVNRNGAIKVKALSIYHNDYAWLQPDEKLPNSVKSFSGQIGFFDFEYFKNLVEKNYDSWYKENSLIPIQYEDDQIFNIKYKNLDSKSILTLAEEEEEYPVFIGKNNDEIVSISVIFELDYPEDKDPFDANYEYLSKFISDDLI